MKLLTYISATGLKGRTFEYQLGKVDLFVGPSFSGKTAVLDAIKIGLLGYHPKLGRRSAATFSLASGEFMSIEGELGGAKLRHAWKMERGSVRYEGPAKMPAIP